MRATTLSVAVVLVLLAGCGDEESSSVAQDGAVSGTSVCELTRLPGGTADDGADIIRERFTCTTEMSDPRVSGTEVLEIETLLYDMHSAPWTIVEGSLSNEDGTWQGTGAGVLRFDEGVPYNYGEMVYNGEGPYAGLTYHLVVAGSNEEVFIAGSIQPTEPTG